MNLLWFFVPGIIMIGFITSYQDLKEGKIRNKWIVAGIIYTLLAYVILIFLFKEIPSKSFIFYSLLNFIIASIVGFLMWNFGFWTAGDGKLFTLFSGMIPLFVYNDASHIQYFPAMNIMINTFVPLFLFLAINALWVSSWKKKKNALKELFDIKKIISFLLVIFSFMWVIEIVLDFFGISGSLFLKLFVILTIYSFLGKFLSFEKGVSSLAFFLLLIVTGLRFLMDKSIYTVEFIQMFAMITSIFFIFNYFVINLGINIYSKLVKIDDVKPGMVPAEMIYEEEKRLNRSKVPLMGFSSYFKEVENKIDFSTEGLSKKDVEKLKKLAKKHKEFKYFSIMETLPFAPFIFAGVLLTILSSGNMMIFIKFLIVNFL